MYRPAEDFHILLLPVFHSADLISSIHLAEDSKYTKKAKTFRANEAGVLDTKKMEVVWSFQSLTCLTWLVLIHPI